MENSDGFVVIRFSPGNLDRYLVRTSILKAIREALPRFNGRLLDAGCGRMPYRDLVLQSGLVTEYVGLDIESARIYDQNVNPDFTWNGKVMPFENGSFDCVLATEVLEHCPDPEAFLGEVFRVLKPGGLFFFTVPFLWNLHEVPYDEYRYTPFALERHLKNVHFKQINIRALGGWHASLAQMLGLWVRRSPMNRILRLGLSYLLCPFIFLLIKMDGRNSVIFREGSMITGLSGLASKPI